MYTQLKFLLRLFSHFSTQLTNQPPIRKISGQKICNDIAAYFYWHKCEWINILKSNRYFFYVGFPLWKLYSDMSCRFFWKTIWNERKNSINPICMWVFRRLYIYILLGPMPRPSAWIKQDSRKLLFRNAALDNRIKSIGKIFKMRLVLNWLSLW